MQMSAHERADSGCHPLLDPASAPAVIREVLAEAGIAINGNSPWDIQVFDARFYRRLLARGSLGAGETYMDGLWDSYQLDEFFHRILRADIDKRIQGWTQLRVLGSWLRETLVNRQAPRRAFEVGRRHYDIGNDVFEAMLDPTMSYSCGYWAEAETLAEAQEHKLRLICRKLELKPGERLLDIGCGWGGLARFAAAHYGVEVLGVTVSEQQARLARERCAGLPVRIELKDYRDVDGLFDKVVSVGMFEHVGVKNYPLYFDAVRRLLVDDGVFLLHTIGDHYTSSRTDPWIERYIFPNGKIPSARQLVPALEGRFLIEDWHSFGLDYDRTLMAWWANFDAAWPRLEAKYGQRFYRMWKYYLLASAGSFRSRQGQLWQLVLAKRERRAPYRSVR
jgi:cyclopropane-fatty-acyl-phospholipid synthase